MNIENHREHRVHRAKLQLSILSASSVVDHPGIFPYKEYEAGAAIGKQPVSRSGYELTRALPENLRSSLPIIEELEAEPGGIHNEESGDE